MSLNLRTIYNTSRVLLWFFVLLWAVQGVYDHAVLTIIIVVILIARYFIQQKMETEGLRHYKNVMDS